MFSSFINEVLMKQLEYCQMHYQFEPIKHELHVLASISVVSLDIQTSIITIEKGWSDYITIPFFFFPQQPKPDNTAGILTRGSSYNRLHQSYLVPVVITDGDYPMQSSTGTLTVRVCSCDRDGNIELCNAEARTSSAGISTGALIAILLCAIILLSK